jgi:phospholipid/cholesterol/gamma-HCH transport system substrate-binding protein
MASQRIRFTVGLFMVSGIGIALVAIIWLGMSRFLEKGQYYVTYFNESVQGLGIDSPVKYRGVSIGRVDRIGVASDSKLIQVVLKIESGQKLDRHIVAQLKSVGITGIMFIELDRKKKGEPDRSPALSFPSEYPIVASKPSDISELLKGIDDVLNQIKSLDLKGISDKIKLSLDSIDRTIADANLKGISTRIESSFDNVDRILDTPIWDNIMSSLEKATQSLNTLMDKAEGSLNRAENTLEQVGGIVTDNTKTIKVVLEDFGKAAESANIFLEKGSSLVSGTNDSLSHLKRQLLVTGQHLEKATENLNRLIELVADQPSQLIFGEPPVPRKMGSDDYER